MKRSIISIALCLALVLTSLSAMFVMPASAANGVDFLAASIEPQEGITAELVDGELVITATAAGQEVALVVPEAASLHVYPYWEGTLTSDIPFDIAYYDANNSKWMFAAGDFCYNFNGNQGAANPIAAGSEDVKMTLSGAYTWTGAPLPENAAVKSITFIAKAAGTITVSKCAMTDGISDVDLNSVSYNAEDTWDNSTSIISTDPAAWTASANNAALTSEIVVSNDEDGNLVFGNTGGQWPAAYADVNMTVPYAGSAVYFDFSVTSEGQTTVYLFFGAATETDFEGEGKGYYAVVGDGTAGNYSGYVYIQDMIPADSDLIDANGNVTISVIKAFGTTAGGATAVCDKAMVLREATVYYNEPAAPETYVTYTVESKTVDALAEGDVLTVDVTATATDDFCGFNFDLAFDDAAFEFVSAEWGTAIEAMAEGTLKNVNDTVEAVDGVKEVRFTVQGGGVYALAEGDVLVSVTLKAKAAVSEAVEIAINDTEVVSDASVKGEYELIAEGVNGIIEFVVPAYDLGDVNDDGSIDVFDVQMLFKYVNLQDIQGELNLDAADVTGDGEVDVFDVQKLFKFVNLQIESL